jgi:Fe-Mn family superoxide dismutase
MAYKLPPLRFGYDGLEPYIDAETMELHHDQHHRAYVDNLNKALERYPQLAELTVEDLLRRIDLVPETIRTAVRNSGGGHVNHQFFWDILGPRADGAPKGAIADAITRDFGSFEHFQSLFTDAATKHVGAGWAFLVVDPSRRRLEIVALPNQESVLPRGTPGLLCCDVWEHAYYLKYRNRRSDYLSAWWKVVAWDVVDERLRDVTA